MEQKELLKLISVGVIALAIGFATGYMPEKAKFDSLRARVEAAWPATAEIRSLIGTVKEVRNNSFVLAVTPQWSPALELPLTREVTITEKTRFEGRAPKDPAVFAKEMNEFEQKLAQYAPGKKGAGVPPAPPSPIGEAITALKDIKAGYRVFVGADKDIAAAITFEAAQVRVDGLAAQ